MNPADQVVQLAQDFAGEMGPLMLAVATGFLGVLVVVVGIRYVWSFLFGMYGPEDGDIPMDFDGGFWDSDSIYFDDGRVVDWEYYDEDRDGPLW